MERDPDGSIRVYIRDYRDPKGLQHRIESFGVQAAVDYVPWGTKCREPRGDFVHADRTPRAMVELGTRSVDEGNRYWKLNPRYIKPDQTFVYVVQLAKDKHGNRSERAVIRLANGPVTPCDPDTRQLSACSAVGARTGRSIVAPGKESAARSAGGLSRSAA